MFEEFCRNTKHEFGTLTPDGMIVMESRRIPFRDCQLTHEDQFRPRPPVTVKKQAAKSILAKAKKILKSHKSKNEEVDYRELYDDEEAHTDAIYDGARCALRSDRPGAVEAHRQSDIRTSRN